MPGLGILNMEMLNIFGEHFFHRKNISVILYSFKKNLPDDFWRKEKICMACLNSKISSGRVLHSSDLYSWAPLFSPDPPIPDGQFGIVTFCSTIFHWMNHTTALQESGVIAMDLIKGTCSWWKVRLICLHQRHEQHVFCHYSFWFSLSLKDNLIFVFLNTVLN